MFRRSRFSVRPNVGGVGRTAASSQEAAPSSQEAKEAPKDVEESVAASTVTDSKPIDAPEAKVTAVSDGNDPSGDGTSSSAAVQRRKRFSVKPRVAPGRLAAITRTPKSPAKVDSKSPPKDSDLEPQIETQVEQSGAQSPTPPEPEPEPEPEPIVASSGDSEQAAAISADHSPKGTKKTDKALVPADDEVIKVPPRPPDKEATAVSEKAKTLLSTKSEKSLIPRFSLSRLLNDPSDIQRMEKALKLRKMLRQEMRKEKRIQKAKRKNNNECTLDPSKMTMRDLIRYLPSSNPMSYSLEDDPQDKSTVSPRKEKSTERVQKLNPEVVPETRRPAEEEEAAAEEEEEEDDAMMVPRVKVAEDGSLILDEESLTVEVKRTKGPNPAEGRDPIFERGSTTTYSSFRPSAYCKPWTSEETDMFFLAISMVGTDFSMIGQLFHNRTRTEIRNKFKKEERQNSWRIDKAFRERRKLDIEYFTKLLEKILEVQANRKKLKSLVRKNSQRSSKVAKSKEFLDDLLDSEEEEDEEEEIDDLLSSEAEDGEKENDEDGKVLASKAGRKRKRKTAEDVSELKSKSKAGEKNNGEDDACTPEDAQAALTEDQPDSQVCEITDKSAESTTIKPAKLSRGSAAKPLLPLGRKWSKKLPPGPTAANADDDVSAIKDGGVADEASKEQMNKETPPEGVDEKENGDDDDDDGGVSSGDEDYTAKPAKPTRYGRVPKAPSLLNYPVKEEGSASKPERKRTPKRSRSTTAPSTTPSSKKSKLITLRASQSESSEDEDEQRQQRDEEEAFVPACLRSPLVVVPQVDETMEELDILGNMSDVLDISQEGLSPNSLCEGDKSETGPPEPCVHQLDLLVDVIDLMSPEHAQVSEVESYNEAAQTLLAIGNVSHPSQSETPPDQRTKTESERVNETDTLLEEEIAEFIEENSSSQIPFSLTDDGVSQTTETPTLEPTEASPQTPNAESVQDYSAAVAEPKPEESTTPLLQESGDCDPASQEVLKSQKATRSRFSKVKPKPNLSQITRSTRPKPQTVKEIRPSPDLESTLKSTAEVEPRPASLQTPELPSSETMVNVSSDAKSAEALERGPNSEAALQVKAEASKTPSFQEGGPVDPAMREESKSQKPEEPTHSEKEISGLTTNETKSKDSDAVESGRSNDQEASKAAVTQPQAEDLNNSTMQELPESQNPSKVVSRRSRFAKVKPNLQISRSLPSKSQSTKEPSTLSDLESTRKATAEVKAPPTCSSTQEPGQGVNSPPKVQPNSTSAARSKDGPDEASNLTSDCQTVEMSTLSIIEDQIGESPAVGEETANISPPQDTVTATSLNSTPDSLPLNITKPDSGQESSGTSEANPVSGEAQAPKCTDETLLPKTAPMRRSRLVKPKPNVGRGPRQSRQAAVKTGADAAPGPRGQATVLSTPLEGADNQVQAASSTSESLTPAQDDSASSTGANQTSANLTVFPDALPPPSDTDEPFFILSLTEVPLDESPHQPPRAEPSTQHSHAEESAVAGPSRSPPRVLCEEMAVATSEVTEHPGPLAGNEDTTTSAVSSSPQRGPKGFLSFLTRTNSAARSESRRGRVASRRPNVSKSMPRKRATAPTAAASQPETTQSTAEPESLTMASQAQASPSLASTEVSSCRHDDGEAVQEDPTDVSQYFLSDIFTEVNET